MHSVATLSGRNALPARDLHAPRSCLVRVSAPRLEDIEPSPSDEVPVTRARYARFSPPPQVSQGRTVVVDTPRPPPPTILTVHHNAQLLVDEEGPQQQRTPLTERQLEEFSNQALGSSSSVWSAEARNLPASTSDSSASLDAVLAQIQGKGPNTVVAAVKALEKRGEYETLVRVLQEVSKPTLEAVCKRWRYADFVEGVALSMKAKPALVFAKLAAPHVQKPVRLYMSVLKACARCRDLDAGLAVVELARKNGVTVDMQMMTMLIKVCKSVGNVDKAYRVYLEMRGARLRIDSHVYGTLIATCAEAMKRDLTVVHERKDQYVLLERAFQYVADAEAAGVALEAPVWNSLMVCAGRSGELNRAFEVLTMMQQRGIGASATTYGSLIESCVCARQAEKALRVFEVAMLKGFVSEVRLYTQALSACMLPFPGAWERAQSIYSALQRSAVKLDKKFFACLMAVAGRCGRLDTAFDLLSEMAAEGIRPSGSSVSAIIHACLDQSNTVLARRVYDLCAKQGVYPVPSQFNRMMDVYASEFRFGEVVSLLCDMVAAGRQPNLNTYRILINACEFTDQAGLAFQVFALMHANKVQILQAKFAQTIYYMLVKACLNQTRYLWVPGGYPPQEPSSGPLHSNGVAGTNGSSGSSNGSSTNGASTSSSGQPHHPNPHPHTYAGGIPAERKMEAEKVLAALGGHKLRRGAHQSNPFDGPPDTIDWASHALSAFHHMLGRGHRPSLEMLDLLLSCLRAKMLPEEEPSGLGLAGVGVGPQAQQPPQPQSYVSPFVPLRPRQEVFEVAFEPRAFAVLEEAINRGLLPKFDPDTPLVLDMRRLPPVVSEVYILHILHTLDRRAKRKAAEADAAAKKAALAVAAGMVDVGGAEQRGMLLAAGQRLRPKDNYHHSITLLVPAFDPDLVKWPSYVARTMNRYTATMSDDERMQLRRRSEHRRSRSYRFQRGAIQEGIAAAAGPDGLRHANPRHGDDDDKDAHAGQNAADGSDIEGTRLHEAVSSYDELEAVIGDGNGDADPWARDDMAAAGDSWSSESDSSDGEDTDVSGGNYRADCTTGLAVAATLQRMKVWMDMDYANGAITVFAVEVARWLKRRRQAAEDAADRAAAAAAGAGVADAAMGMGLGGGSTPGSHRNDDVGAAASGVGMGLAGSRMMGRGAGGPMSRGPVGVEAQQRNIRLGMMTGTVPPGGGPPSSSAGASGGPLGRSMSVGGAGMGPGSGSMNQQQQQGATAGAAAATSGRGRQIGSTNPNQRGGAQRAASAPADLGGADEGSPDGSAAAFESLAARLASSAGPEGLNRPGARRVRKGGVTVTANGPVGMQQHSNDIDSEESNGRTKGYSNGRSNGHANGSGAEPLLFSVQSQRAVEVSVAPGMPVKFGGGGGGGDGVGLTAPEAAAAPGAAATATSS